MKNIKTYLLLFLFTPAVFWGQKIHRLTVEDAVKNALQFRKEVRNASLDVKIAQKRVLQTLGIGLPQINGSAELKYNYQLPTNVLPAVIFGGPPGRFVEVQFGTDWNSTLSLSASQLIFNGTYFVGVQASKAYKDLMQLNLELNEKQITQKVHKAYYNVLITEERAKLLQTNIDKVRKLLQNTEAMNKEGFVENIDVDRLTVLYNNLKSEQDNLQRFIKLNYSLLKFQIGISLQDSIVLLDSLPELDTDSLEFVLNQQENFSNIYNNRKEISMLKQQQRLYELNIKKERVGYLPSLVGIGVLGTQAYRTEFDIFDTNKRWFAFGFVGLRLQMPVFDGFQRHYRIQEAKLQLMKAQNELENTQSAIQLQVQQTKTALLNQLNKLKTQKKNMELALKVLEQARKKYYTGVGSNIEVIQAESDYKTARINYYNALLEAYNLFIDYKYSIGKL